VKLSRRQAVRDCKKVWRLVYYGKVANKLEALRLLPHLREKYRLHAGCPLCALTTLSVVTCLQACPYATKYGVNCMDVSCDYQVNHKEFAARIMKIKE
jgi:hypothetical protein